MLPRSLKKKRGEKSTYSSHSGILKASLLGSYPAHWSLAVVLWCCWCSWCAYGIFSRFALASLCLSASIHDDSLRLHVLLMANKSDKGYKRNLLVHESRSCGADRISWHVHWGTISVSRRGIALGIGSIGMANVQNGFTQAQQKWDRRERNTAVCR
jgi:hypothetical protein